LNQPGIFVTELEQELQLKDREIYDLRTLITIAKVLTSSLTLERILDSLIFACFGQFTCSKAAIYIYNSESEHFCLGSQKGYEDDNIREIFESDEILFDFFLRNEYKAVKYSDLQKHLDKKSLILEEMELLKPKAISPFAARNAIYGYIFLSEKMTGEDFHDEEVNFLTSLSNLAGLALYNARLHEMATLDQLTRLVRPHFFHTRLNEEISESNKFKKPLTLVMMDMDNFKDVNDNYGHISGDLVLQDCGKIIRSNCRAEDVPARYGGDEFAILLPDTRIEGGLNVANRIKRAMQKHTFVSTQGDALKITCSIGIINYDYTIPMDKDTFFEMADKLMYHSKKAGRDKISWRDITSDKSYIQEFAHTVEQGETIENS